MVNPQKIFFFHNPKAGGSSIRQILQSRFRKEDRCPIIEDSQRDHEQRAGLYDEFQGYAYYAGHYGYDIYSKIAPQHLAVTNFREPAARLLSLYNFYRLVVPIPPDPAQQDNYYAVRFAKSVSFDTFVSAEDPRIEIHTRNHHVRQLSSSGWKIESQGDLGAAMALVDRMCWYYICEFPALSDRWARAFFGPEITIVPRVNITPTTRNDLGVGQISEATRRIIFQKNRLDYRLHDHAVRRLFHLFRAPDPNRN